jgi:hypothetical protein
MDVAESRLLNCFQNSSYFIFHIDNPVRMFLLKLTEPKDVYEELVEMRTAVHSTE